MRHCDCEYRKDGIHHIECSVAFSKGERFAILSTHPSTVYVRRTYAEDGTTDYYYELWDNKTKSLGCIDMIEM